MRVGIFDSGRGGLSVLGNVLEARLFSEIIYYGDTARVPYGSKDKATIIKFATQALVFFKQRQVDMLIIACNTVSAYALDILQSNVTFPIIGVIEPGVIATKNKLKECLELNQVRSANILVIATKATIKSNIYEDKLKNMGFHNIKSLASGLFVPLVEEGIFEGPILESTMDYYFKSLDVIPDALILGCTHFPLISNALSKYFLTHFDKKILLIHSGEAIVEYIKTNFKLRTGAKRSNLIFYASDDVRSLALCARDWLKLETNQYSLSEDHYS